MQLNLNVWPIQHSSSLLSATGNRVERDAKHKDAVLFRQHCDG